MAPGAGGGDAAAAEPLFQVSEVLADRFRVVRLLGRGGMGEVYEVDDLELGERIAVKTLRSHLLTSDRALALFRNEIQLARRVTHPNVCRVFDVFRHRRVVEGASESVALVTMERLPGGTLAQRIDRGGPLAPAEALPILRQIAEALDAAHAAGIVHRDLKSANVVLVDRPGGPRAVVTDFGIAAAAEEAGGAGRAPAGTAPYMAPEQRTGAATGRAADLYAFGVVIREMVTGRAAAEAGADAGAELPPGWPPIVTRCLAETPSERPASALDVCRRLAAAAERRRRWPARAAAAAALALAAVLAGIEHLPLARVPGNGAGAAAAETPPAPARRALALAVAPAAASGDGEPAPVWTAIAASLLLVGELEALDLDLSPRSAPFASIGGAADPGAGADVAARVAVSRTDGGGLRLDLEVEGTGERPLAVSRAVAVEALPEATADLAVAIAERLGVTVKAGAAERRRALVGDDPAALEALARGLAALDDFRHEKALSFLSKAVAREPSAFEPRHALSRALFQLSRSEEARAHADVAQRLAEALGAEQRGLADAGLALADSDFAGAAAAYAELVRLRPGRQDFALVHASLLLANRQPARARQALEAVAERLPAIVHDPRYALVAANLASQENDYANWIALARAARSGALELGLSGLAFEAIAQEFYAQSLLNRAAEMAEVAVEAVALARATAEPQLLGRALRLRGEAYLSAGETEEGRRMLKAAAVAARRTGDRHNLIWCLNRMAYIAQLEGDLDRAEDLLHESLDNLRQGGQAWAILVARQRLADLSFQRGRLAEAGDEAREILASARSLGLTNQEASALEILARVALERGELDEAARLVAALEALATQTEHGELAIALTLAADLHRQRGEALAGRRLAQRSLAALDRGGMPVDRVHALEVGARVESDIAGPAAGLAAMREAQVAAAALGFAFHQARVEREIARLERLLGNLPRARRILVRALATHERVGAHLELAHDRLELARLVSAEGDDAAAAAVAREALADYRRLGNPGGVRAALAFLDGGPAAGAGGEA